MHTRRSIPAIFAAALLSLSPALPLAAQTWSDSQWVGDYYFVQQREGSGDNKKSMYYFIDENNNVVNPGGYALPANREEWHGIWFNDGYRDTLYKVVYGDHGKVHIYQNKDGSTYQKYEFMKWQEGEWHFLGEYKDPAKQRGDAADGWYDSSLRFFPCDNDRFIAVSWFKDIVDDKRPDRSPFAKMRLHPSKKELVLDGSIPYGIDELSKQLSDRNIRGVFTLPSNAHHIVTGKYATIINQVTGLYWCFNLEKATLVKAGSIFKGIDPEEMLKTIQKGGFTMAVLGANPEKDGTVLVSALEEAALKGGVADKWKDLEEKYNKPLSKDLTEQEREKLNREREKAFIEDQKKLAKGSPYIVWYRIHPENGRVEKLGTPPIGGAYERAGFFSKLWLGMEFWRADEWRPLPDGSVRMGLLEVKASKTTDKKTAQESGKK